MLFGLIQVVMRLNISKKKLKEGISPQLAAGRIHFPGLFSTKDYMALGVLRTIC